MPASEFVEIMRDEEALEQGLLTVDDSSELTNCDGSNRLHLNSRTKPCTEVSFYISETIWSSVSWELEMARKLLNYSTHSLAIFDVTYVIMLALEIVFNYDQWSNLHRIGGVPFTVFFIIFLIFNSFAPPLGMHLIKSILLHPTIPMVFHQATKYDPKFHFRMHCLAHFNCAASILLVLLSFFTNPIYKSVQLPFLILYVVPLSFTLSVVVTLLEGHRLLICQFIESLENKSLFKDDSSSANSADTSGEKQYLPEDDAGTVDDHRKSQSKVDFYKLRNQYYDLHVQLDGVRENWGLKLLFIVIALLLFTVGLVWYMYISEFKSRFSLVLPYVVISLFGLCEILFSLTLVNELGAKVSKTLAKFIFQYRQNSSTNCETSIITDINNLLLLSQIVPIEIPFVEGFSLRVRLTAVLVGPLIGAIVPKFLK